MDFSDCKTVPDILYKSFRNKLTHAYRSYGVYITGDETNSWSYCDGYLQLNPFWFWSSFKAVYTSLFDEALAASAGNTRRDCVTKYIEEMLA